ncbi:hypothetical protein JHN63_09640 [Streptomyces sp. MBT65]|uniref:hypothetical protein n=1 Tax=Streptomyces sp. MBT65 TaxID=1488395 RepID=UPI00190D38CF|nr:hypothetical protein [Streptomyces sp. MBT65]MBK3574078.1 hypothetical protein [Streptomyces sp. MBT65]
MAAIVCSYVSVCVDDQPRIRPLGRSIRFAVLAAGSGLCRSVALSGTGSRSCGGSPGSRWKMPAVVSADGYGQRREIAAGAFPASGGEDDWLHRRLLQQAVALGQQAIRQDAAEAYRAVESALDETAARLLEQGVLDDVHDAPARRIVATDFLIGLTGGHRPKARTLTLLLGRPAVKEFLIVQKAAARREIQPVLPL